MLVRLVVLAAFGALHWYAWRRLVRDTMPRGSLQRRAGSVVFVAGPLLTGGTLVAERPWVPFLLEQILAWPGYLWMVVFLYLLLTLLAGEAVRPLLRRWLARRDAGAAAKERARRSIRPPVAGRPGESGAQRGEELAAVGPRRSLAVAHGGSGTAGDTPEPVAVAEHRRAPASAPSLPGPSGLSRRLFVSRVVGGTATAVAVGTVGYGTASVLRGPQVKRLTIPLAKLPRSAHGFRIAVVATSTWARFRAAVSPSGSSTPSTRPSPT